MGSGVRRRSEIESRVAILTEMAFEVAVVAVKQETVLRTEWNKSKPRLTYPLPRESAGQSE